MRTTGLLAALFLTAAASMATADSAKPRSLSASDVSSQLQVVQSEVQQCYLDRAVAVRGAGKLELTLSIDKRGTLYDVAVATPGLPAKVAKKVDGCVKHALDGLAFGEAKTETTAKVPFFFQKTVAPDAGPQLSCYRASGCK